MEDNVKIKKKNIIAVLIVCLCIIVIATVLFFVIFANSPKSTVKDFVNAAKDGNTQKIISLIDKKGYAVSYKTSFNFNALIYNNKLSQYNISDFINRCNTIDELDNEDNLTENIDSLIDALKNAKINDITEKPIEGFDGISLVTVNMKLATKDEANNYKFYTCKKGLKHYIIDFPTFIKW